MLKRVLPLLVVASVTVTGWAQNPDWPSSLTVGTASVGGTYFIYGGGWANLIQQELGIPTSTEVTGGPSQNMLLIETGDIELGMVTLGPAFEIWSGSSELTGGAELREARALFPMYNTPFHFIALEGSDITMVSQVDGTAVGVGPAGGTSGTFMPKFLDALSLDTRDRQAGASDMASQLLDGQLDAIGFAAGIPIAAYSEIEAQRAASIFSFNDDERAALLGNFSYLNEAIIPAGTYSSLVEDLPTVGMYNFAVADKDIPEDLAYEIVKAVFDNLDFMIETHRAASDTSPNDLDRNAFLWLHPGAIRYYEEMGIEVPEALYPPEYQAN
ncbi:MAG: TAXI family TRAP transporter solute-binding subunit [Deinococcota bacterium]